MNYLELKSLLSTVQFKLFHEVQEHKDYYFCFIKRADINTQLIKMMNKHQSISKDEFQKICHAHTADVLAMADDHENDCFVFFVDTLDIRANNYIQQSLFLYKHISNIVSFKLFNSYFDETTFKSDLVTVLDNNAEFKYIKHGKNSPSGMAILKGNYRMHDNSSSSIQNEDSNENTEEQKASKNPDDALREYQRGKPSIEKGFNIKDFEKIGLKRIEDEDFADHFLKKVDTTSSFVSDIFSEVSENIQKTVKKKAPIVKKNATVVGNFIGKKIVQAVHNGGKIIEQKIKEEKIRRLENTDLFDLDVPQNSNEIKTVKITKNIKKHSTKMKKKT